MTVRIVYFLENENALKFQAMKLSAQKRVYLSKWKTPSLNNSNLGLTCEAKSSKCTRKNFLWSRKRERELESQREWEERRNMSLKIHWPLLNPFLPNSFRLKISPKKLLKSQTFLGHLSPTYWPKACSRHIFPSYWRNACSDEGGRKK